MKNEKTLVKGSSRINTDTSTLPNKDAVCKHSRTVSVGDVDVCLGCSSYINPRYSIYTVYMNGGEIK